MFLREDIKRRKGKIYIYHRIVKTYWDKVKKKVRHKVIMNLGRLSKDEVNIVKNLLSLKGTKDAFITTWSNIRIKKSLQYLSCCILHRMFNFFELGDFIDKVGKKNKIKISSIVEILTIFRCIKPSSDLKVSNFCKKTILPYLLGIKPDKINPTRIYRTLDALIKCEDKLQIHIYNQIKKLNLDDFNLVYYDITSTYFEGKGECSLILYGLSRDKRPDKKQVLLALATTKKGYPFYWEVLPGNIVDKKTIKDIVNNLKEKFGIKSCCIVLDRGMVTDDNLDEIESRSLFFIVALTKDEIRRLKGIPWEYLREITEERLDITKQRFRFYNERAYYEELKEQDGKRYILCFNPEKFLQERKDREDKIKSIEEYFKKKNLELLSSKKTRDRNKIETGVYYYLKKRKATKYFKDIEIEEGEKEITKKYKAGYKKKVIKVYSIKYKINTSAINKEKLLDGVYVICSNFWGIDTKDLISGYRGRIKIERAFMQMKQFLEIRPIYHRTEDRIKAHVFICVLAYLLNVLLEYKVSVDGGLKLSYEEIYQILECGDIEEVEVKNIRETRLKVVEPDDKQIKILKVLGYEDILEERDKFMI